MNLFKKSNEDILGKNVKDSNNKSIYDNLFNLFESIIKKSAQKLSLEEILSIYETNIDNMIIESVKMNELIYIDGKFQILKDKDSLNIKVECYFQDRNKNWIKKDSLNKIDIYKLTDESIANIEDNKIITFAIETPKGI